MATQTRRKRVRFPIPVTAAFDQFADADGNPDNSKYGKRRRRLCIRLGTVEHPCDMASEVILSWVDATGTTTHALIYNLHVDKFTQNTSSRTRREIV